MSAPMDEQIAYYRARAAEYDATAYPDERAARRRIAAALAALAVRRPAGDVLELACGTGVWTRALARRAGTLTALDSAPEAIALARRRCPPGVRFAAGDLRAWRAPQRYDLIFFGFWLSHVPAGELDGFLELLRGWLAPGGRVAFVDEHARAAGAEPELAGESAVRTLTDGRRFRIVKHFLDPGALADRLAAAGWRASIAGRDDWVLGQAWPAAG